MFHDRTSKDGPLEQTLALHELPSPTTLWARYREWKGLPPEADDIVLQDYYSDGSDRGPRYYQASAVNAEVEAVAKGQNRLLLVMATGTGKTYTAFQIIWRLWRAKRKKRVLFLGALARLLRPHRRGRMPPRQRRWREILTNFGNATQIGMTATPKETAYVSNIHYFGPPVYSYSLKQGIQDGFLAPYKVVKVHIDRDLEGYRPEPGRVDDHGRPVEDRIYNTKDFGAPSCSATEPSSWPGRSPSP